MRATITGLCILAMGIFTPSGGAQAQARIGLDIQNGEVRNFYLTIGDYYRAPVREIEVVRERGIPEDEIPVVYCIARHSRYQPSEIVQMRLNGDSWMDISTRCGVGPDAYSVDGYGVSGPPYGNAYGYYRHEGRPGWRRAYLSDDAIITSVNARWMHDRYGWSAPDVVRWRSHGESFRSIYGRYRSNQEQGGHERGRYRSNQEQGGHERGGDNGGRGNHRGNHRGGQN